MEDDVPEWVKSALDVEGVAILPAQSHEPLRCNSCGQKDDCSHGEYEWRENGSYICILCDRILHGGPIKGESRCAECGRKWK